MPGSGPFHACHRRIAVLSHLRVTYVSEAVPALPPSSLSRIGTMVSNTNADAAEHQAQAPQAKRRKLVGYKNFKRCNPKSDKFDIRRFHHVELWCGDATNTARR